MNTLQLENLHERLINISEPDLKNFLDLEKNQKLKTQVLKCMFKSHSYLSKKCENFSEWSNKIIFFQYLAGFLDYLENIQSE